MTKAIGVKFPHTLKVYDFLAGDIKVKPRDFVVTETAQGQEIGQVVYIDKEVKDENPEEPIIEIERIATKDDIEKMRELQDEAKIFFPNYIDRIEHYNLPMTPIAINISLDESKVVYFFSSDGRVDFRELAKDLSRSVKKQAIMRQIGPRDEAKLIGGYGRCGLPLCCATFLTAADNISLEDAEKAYGMSKSAPKISGVCGRLMCCIKFEEGEGRKK